MPKGELGLFSRWASFLQLLQAKGLIMLKMASLPSVFSRTVQIQPLKRAILSGKSTHSAFLEKVAAAIYRLLKNVWFVIKEVILIVTGCFYEGIHTMTKLFFIVGVCTLD